MSNKLLDFLVAMAEDPDLRKAFDEDADACMTAHGLSAEEQDLVRRGDVEEIQRRVGDGVNVMSDGHINAYRK